MSGYRGRFFVRKRVWVCGDYVEADVYPVFQAPGQRRKKCRPTREVQERINRRDAERKAARIAHTNFTRDDYALDLTLEEPMEAKEAIGKLRAYFRRLRKRYRKAGVELKYMYAVEQGARSGRVHFHLIINGGAMSRDELEAEWGLGYANSRRLQFSEAGITGLVDYITKAGRKKKRVTYRSWSCSKNLVRPEPEISDGEVTVREAEELGDAIERRSAAGIAEDLFPGYALAEAEAMRNLHNRGMYIHLHLARPECWNGRPPRAEYLSGELGEDYADEQTQKTRERETPATAHQQARAVRSAAG